MGKGKIKELRNWNAHTLFFKNFHLPSRIKVSLANVTFYAKWSTAYWWVVRVICKSLMLNNWNGGTDRRNAIKRCELPQILVLFDFLWQKKKLGGGCHGSSPPSIFTINKGNSLSKQKLQEILEQFQKIGFLRTFRSTILAKFGLEVFFWVEKCSLLGIFRAFCPTFRRSSLAFRLQRTSPRGFQIFQRATV